MKSRPCFLLLTFKPFSHSLMKSIWRRGSWWSIPNSWLSWRRWISTRLSFWSVMNSKTSADRAPWSRKSLNQYPLYGSQILQNSKSTVVISAIKCGQKSETSFQQHWCEMGSARKLSALPCSAKIESNLFRNSRNVEVKNFFKYPDP